MDEAVWVVGASRKHLVVGTSLEEDAMGRIFEIETDDAQAVHIIAERITYISGKGQNRGLQVDSVRPVWRA